MINPTWKKLTEDTDVQYEGCMSVPIVYKWLNKTEWKGYGFKIEEVEEIRPIEISGKLSLWEYDY